MMKCFLLLVALGGSLYDGAEICKLKKPLTFDGVAQVVYFQEGIISGAKPENSDGFASLNRLNVQTIICVDGVVPDVQLATSHGIKTIHIPLKYCSPSAEQVFDLATVVTRGQQHGNVYIHCHQGKHRSATAAAIVSIALGYLTVDEAKERMLISETSPTYEGLWNAVEETIKINRTDLGCNKKNYPSAINPVGMTNQMIAIDEAMDNVLRLQQAGWQSPADHPDLVGVAEVGLITDIFRTIQVSHETNGFPSDFETQLANAMHQATDLEEALVEGLPTKALDEHLTRVEQSCIRCHSTFRK